MVAKNPPMGWNSWDCYGAAVKEQQVRENAEYMAKYMKEYGWEYVVVDIQWYQPTAGSHAYEPFSEVSMDEYGRLLPAENRFPSAAGGKGFAPLAEYVHSLGLKFGIHIMRGMPRMAAHLRLQVYGTEYTADEIADPNSICCWNPDMYGLKCLQMEEGARAYYESIFALYAQWGVDFVKVDDIAREYPHCEKEIEIISQSLRKCGREMVLSLSPGPAPLDKAEHLKKYANMWRITDDFWDDWKLLLAMFERAEKWCTHAGPGHWPDADMLPVGALRQCTDATDWTHFSKDEQMTMMSLWCMMRAPLIAGGDLPKNDDFSLRLLTNADILEIEKTTHCAHQLYRTEDEIAWLAPRRDGQGVYVALFNISERSRMVGLQLEQCDLDNYTCAKELWSGKESRISGVIKTKLPKHGAAVYKLV
ncbi:MAG: glycoside hydrolase family 27 protein [Acetatifactor sp.]